MNPRMTVLAASLIAINLALAKVAALLALPVYLDSVGTILAAVMLPPGFAIGVAAATSLLAGVVIHPAFPFYLGTQIVIALLVMLATRIGAFNRWWTAVAAGLGIAVTASFVSAPVTVLVFGGVTLSGTTAINAVLMAAGKNIWQSVITGSIVIEAVDKTATCLIAWMVLQRLPSQLLRARAA